MGSKRLAAAILAMLTMLSTSAYAQNLYLEAADTPNRGGAIQLDSAQSKDVPRETWLRENGRLQVRNVGRATLEPFLPPAHLATGEAVIVAPGGGFLGLAIDSEGWAVAQALADKGIAAFVLKYRVLPTPASFDAFRDALLSLRRGGTASFKPPADTPPRSLDDAAAALRYVRAHAASYGIDPAKVGFMGFSAGGFLTLSAALDLPTAERPAFIAPIYPKMTARTVPADAPPMFVAIARDDFLLASGSLGLIESWQRAGCPVEFHLYEAGGHGFGLGRFGTPTDSWFASFLRWIEYRRAQRTSNTMETKAP